MKRLICALLMISVLLSSSALAASINEAIMIYEDYDGNRTEQTVSDAVTLAEIEGILRRAFANPVMSEERPMNSTLFCMMDNGEIYDFALTTDGSNYITSRDTDDTFLMDAVDNQRLWEIFSEVQAGMGFNAYAVFDF